MKKQIVATALILSLAGTAAVAGQGGPHRGPHGHGPWFAQLDANKDGQITREEVVQAQQARFARFDSNGDGVLSAEELDQGLRREQAERRLKMMDRDGDGVVSADEFTAIATAHFDKADRNDDGVLSKDDRPAKRDGKRGEDRPRKPAQ